MSACLYLMPLALTVIYSSVECAADLADKFKKSNKKGKSEKIITRFNDEEILKQTLHNYGAKVSITSDHEIIADFGKGKISYRKENSDKPYFMQIYDVDNYDGLTCDIKEINEDYGNNVQKYTYLKLKNSLQDDMHIEKEEVLEDNSIVLTINID